MSNLDLRTRFQNDDAPVDARVSWDHHLPTLIATHGTAASRSASYLSLRPLTFDVEGEILTLATGAEGIALGPSSGDGLLVAMDSAAFSDLLQDRTSTFGAQMLGLAIVKRGTIDDFVAWEPALRTLLDGRPAYEPGAITFHDRNGAPLDLQRSFTLDDRPEEIGHFLTQAGFLHVAGVFSETEMAEVSSELDDAIHSATRDDGASWWARTEAGEWYPSRILGFNQKSATLRALLHSERFKSLGTFTDDHYVQRSPDVGDSAEGLLKKVGVVEGISDVSWHKDCSMGGHSRGCSGLTVGISVTGAGPENGELGVVAGSHRANIAPLGIDGIDLPRLPLATRPGDITIHCSCTLHMSRHPVSAERRVVYTGFSLAPRPGDRPAQADQEQIRRDRAALGDTVRSHRHSDGRRTASFDL